MAQSTCEYSEKVAPGATVDLSCDTQMFQDGAQDGATFVRMRYGDWKVNYMGSNLSHFTAAGVSHCVAPIVPQAAIATPGCLANVWAVCVLRAGEQCSATALNSCGWDIGSTLGSIFPVAAPAANVSQGIVLVQWRALHSTQYYEKMRSSQVVRATIMHVVMDLLYLLSWGGFYRWYLALKQRPG
eukprot:NODE_4699_length_1028_cov_131.854144_g4495_i0.p1 GENE.NODE_4699_length_1028_cov_131.854144_g4495_i0~~NODE_4699_length_1028_cov_131.854144_g4495_i0.p1  ORF type:complete len:185 (+),score=9.84 NODE_4699_length_1028_cov_131.854144_g4495_i0:80-634(+)